ncbi:MAG: HEAT repeat domain-containing protein [Gemmataceae bacterium]|nr:HEAT repeat domain-containing protein [Gemmataceae bacterium]
MEPAGKRSYRNASPTASTCRVLEEDRALRAQSDYWPQVERLLTCDRATLLEIKHALTAAGEQAVGSLVAAVKDPRFHVPPATVTATNPLRTVLEVLAETGPVSAIPDIAVLLEHQEEEVRELAASALGNFARVESVPYLRTAFQHADAGVRRWALDGIYGGSENRHCPIEFREQLFDDVVRLLDDPEVAEKAVSALVRLQAEKSKSVLLDKKYFSSDFWHITKILQAFQIHGVQVPEDAILGLLNELKSKPPEVPYCSAYGKCLQALARMKSPRALPLILEALDADFDQSISKGGRDFALNALGILQSEEAMACLQRLSKHRDKKLAETAKREIQYWNSRG